MTPVDAVTPRRDAQMQVATRRRSAEAYLWEAGCLRREAEGPADERHGREIHQASFPRWPGRDARTRTV